MFEDLEKLIAVESVLGEPEDGAPFGRKNAEALDAFLEIAASYGLKTGRDGGYAGWAEYGEGKTLVGVLGHLDVVPAGSGWSFPPFALTVDGGRLYGRGVSDDKGPLVACLHALARLKEENAELGCRVRLIAGCNEESGNECIAHYVKNCEIPTVSFTPDSDFPVIASEKGITHLSIIFGRDEKLDDFVAVSAGERPNIVPNHAEAVVRVGSELFGRICSYGAPLEALRLESVATALAESGCELSDFSAEAKSDGLHYFARGVAAHGSTPEKGINAAHKILALVGALSGSESAAWLRDNTDPARGAERLGLGVEDVTGKTTVNLGMLRFDGGRLTATVDVRTPACVSSEEVENSIRNLLPDNARLEIIHAAPPLAFDENDKLVRTLLGVYRDVTGDCESAPLHIGGGTYAKELPNCVAFGAVFPGKDTHMHEPDEFYPVEDFYRLEEIYYRAIKELCKAYKQ